MADNIRIDSSGASYFFEFDSSAACVTGGGFSVVFFVCFILVVVGYISGGILWNKFKNGKEWTNAFPHIDFWKSFPSYVMGGVQYIISKVKK